MSTANTPKLDLLRIQDTWQFGDEAFNRFIDDADDKLVGVAHLDDKAHWSTWKKDTAYVKNDIVRIQNNKSHQYYQCITAGTSGTTEPTNNVTGSVVTDGTVTWMVMSLSEATSNGGVIQIWLSGNYYHRGDAVIYGTALYRCKVDHTSSDWNTDYDYWQEVFASIRLWKPVIYYFENDTAIVDNSIYKCIVAHKSGTVFDSTEEANWEMIGGAGGAEEWASNTKYAENQLVTKDGILYQCNTAHTSGTDFDLDIANWNIVYASIVPWELNVYYPAGGVVTYEDCIYRCIAGNEATIDFDEVKDNYELIFANLQVWKPDVTYLVGSIVLYDDVLYRCNTVHTSAIPFDVTMWDLIFANIREYGNNTVYKLGSVVIYDRNLYRCVENHTSDSDNINYIKVYESSSNVLTVTESTTLPEVALVDLGDEYDIRKIYFEQSVVGADINELDVEYSLDNSTFSPLYSYSNTSATPWNEIEFSCNVTARYLRFKAKAVNISGLTGSASIKNLEVMGDNTFWELLHNFDIDITIDNWSSGVLYEQNEIVLHDGILYRANVEHTSSSDFLTDSAKWDIIYSSIPVWVSGNDYKIGEMILKDNIIYRCTVENNDVTFDFDKWDKLTASFIKDWESGTGYNENELVIQDGILYRANISHISDTTSFINDADKWDIVYSSIPLWQANNNYVVGDVVLYSDCIYRCITSNDDSVFNPTKWDRITFNNIKNWEMNTEYEATEVVLYDDVLYRANINHTSSSSFSTDVTKWDLVYANIRQYADNTVYKVGSVVIYNGNLYRCIQSHTSSDGFDMVKIHSVSGGLFTAYKRDIPVEYVLDLDNPYDIAKIVLDYLGSFAAISLMDVYGSIDNVTFKKIGIYSNPSASSTYGTISVEIVPMSIQYLKFVVRGENTFDDPLSRPPFVTLQNLEVYGNGNYWELIGNFHTFILNWQSDKKYKENEVVLHNDTLYRSNTSHFSSVFNDDIDNWEIIYASIGLWQANEAYKEGQTIIYDSNLYRCVNSHISTTTFDDTNWELICSSGATIENWTTNTDYEVGNLVIYNNSLYQCTTANNDASFTPAKWQLIGGGSSGSIEDWVANTSYAVDDLVIYSSVLYKCLTANNDATFDGTKWQAISKENTMMGATSSANGTEGLVPAPTTNDVNKFLCGDGTWANANGINVVHDVLWENTSGAVISTNDVLTLAHSVSDYDYIILTKYTKGTSTNIVTPAFFDGATAIVFASNPSFDNYSITLNASGTSCVVVYVEGDGKLKKIEGIKFLNPNVYSTTEQRIGTWIDGKPLYQRTYTGTMPSVANTSTTIIDVSSFVDKCVDISGYILSSGSQNSFPINLYDLGAVNDGFDRSSTVYMDGSKNIRASVTPDTISTLYTITIKYTKTTD